MIEYLEEILGLNIRMESWDKAPKLPAGLYVKRLYYKVECDDRIMLAIRIPQNDVQKKRLYAYFAAIEKICSYPVVFWIDSITTYQRKMMVAEKIAFVVPGSQCYIPFLGMCFRERMPSISQRAKAFTSFSAAAQVLALHGLYYTDEEEIPQAGLEKKTSLSLMAVSRGIRELEELGLIEVKTIGRRRFICFKDRGDSLYDRIKDYLISPVLSRHYVAKSKDKIYVLAGESALARKTMLNPPRMRCFAVDKDTWDGMEQDETDPSWYSGEMDRIEVWKYDPALFARDGAVDAVSLVRSLKDCMDERVEGEIGRLTGEEKWYLG